MTPLRKRMVNDMTVRGLAENTKKSYLNSVSGLACHYGRSPERISAQEVQDYLLFRGICKTLAPRLPRPLLVICRPSTAGSIRRFEA